MTRVCLQLCLLSDGQYRYRDGDIRLVGGSYQWEGRVEIYLSGSWGTIADSDWTEEDAAVTCHTLGHILPGLTATHFSPCITCISNFSCMCLKYQLKCEKYISRYFIPVCAYLE